MTKSKTTVDDDGWTRISRQDRRAASSSITHKAPVRSARDLLDRNWSFRPPLPPPLFYTIDYVRQRYEEIERKWLISESSRRLVKMFEQEVLPSQGNISSCVLLGTGTFCGSTPRHDVALLQAAVFKTVLDVIGLGPVGESVSLS